MPTPAQHAQLGRLTERLESAKHGEKGALIDAAAAEMGVTMQTVHHWLKDHRYLGRKRRSDAGEIALDRDEAMRISLAIRYGISGHGKERMTLEKAVTILRQDGLISASRADENTGEILPLSFSAIARALKAYHLDAVSLATPAPHRPLASLHPNHVWQVDASVCVVFYLPGEAGNHGLMLIDEKNVYKNKPDKVRAIELFRVIRYVVTDHASGVVRWRFYSKAESGEATCRFLAWAMARKADSADPFHGRPRIVMVDPGATSAGTVKRFCARMGIDLIVNTPHNPRGKGQVEQGQNLVELEFESGLRHVRHRVRDFHELNALAERYQMWFNTTKEHSRHGETRFASWMRITPEQLIETAPYARLLTLITGKTETPLVQGDLSVRFDGRRWNVREVPDVVIDQPLTVSVSPFSATGVVAVRTDATGKEIHFPLDEIVPVGDFGFPSNAAVIGEGYKAMPDTLIEKNKKEMLLVATGAKDLKEAKKLAARKGFDPFGGRLNPYRAAEEHQYAIPLPRAATPMPEALVEALPEIAPRVFPVIRAAKQMRAALGEAWNEETYEWLRQQYPEGVPEDELARLIARAAAPVPMRVVAGGSS
jgi:transposase InsO family protein